MDGDIRAGGKRVARRTKFAEQTTVRFKRGTFARMDDLRAEDEDRADFVRVAVEKELGYRAAGLAKRKPGAGE